MKLLNNYFILRHGNAFSNKEGFVSSWPEKRKNPLTKKGEKQIQKIIPKLKKEKIDLFFSSDLLRTKQTAEMIAKGLKIKIKFDKRLRERDTGIFNDKSIKEWRSYFKNQAEKSEKRPPQGESRRDIKKRVLDFIKDIDQKYKNKNILIISHEDPLMVLESAVKEMSEKDMIKQWKKLRINPGKYRKL